MTSSSKWKNTPEEREFKFREWKESMGCQACDKPYAHYILQVDHIEPVSNGGSKRRKWSHLSTKTLESEMWNLQVLCANCHAIKTWEQRKP